MRRTALPLLMLLAAAALGAFIFWPEGEPKPLEEFEADPVAQEEELQEAQLGREQREAQQEETRELQESWSNSPEANSSELLAAVQAGGPAKVRAVDQSGALLVPATFLARDRAGKLVWLNAPEGELSLDRLNRFAAVAAFAAGHWSSPTAIASSYSNENLDLRADKAAAHLTVSLSLAGAGPEPQATCLFRRLPPGTQPDLAILFGGEPEEEVWEAYVDDSGIGEDSSLFSDAFSEFNPASPRAQVVAGQFELRDLPPGLMKLDLSSPLGVPVSEIVELEPGETEIVEVSLVEGGWLEGRIVTVTQEGFAGAVIGTLSQDSSYAEFAGERVLTNQLESDFLPAGRFGRSDETGAFRFGPIEPGKHLVMAVAEQMLPARLDDAEIQAGQTTRLPDAVLRGGHAIAVLARSQLDGSVLDEIQVSWKSGEGGLLADFEDWNAAGPERDAAGRVLLSNLPFQALRIRVEAEGFAPQEQEYLIEASMWFPDSSPAELTFNLIAGHRLAGRVLDTAGNPAVDAEVAVIAGNADANPFALFAGVQVGDLPNQRTDESGGFSFDNLPPAEYRVIARNEVDAPAISEAVDLESVPSARVDLQLSPAATVRVEYTPSEDGKFDGALVTLLQTELNIPMRRSTDAEGIVEFMALPAGNYNLNVLPAEAISETDPGANVDLSMQFFALAEGERKVVQIGEGLNTATLAGQLTQNGQAVAGISLTVITDGGVKVRKTDKEGRFTFEALPVGPVTWFAGPGQSPAYAGTFVLESGENELVYELPGGGLEVTVRSASDGAPATGVPVTATTTDSRLGNPVMALTDTEGIARFQFLAEGNYLVAAGSAAMPLFSSSNGLGTKSIDVAVGSGLAHASIDLEEGATFKIRALDANGQAVAGASMFYLTEQGRPLSGLSMSGTNSKGVAQLTDLPAGPGRILVKHPTAGQLEFEINLTAGQLDKREIRLEAGVTLYLTVRGETGEQMPGIMAVLRNERGARITMTFSMRDAQEFNQSYFGGTEQKLGPVAPGRYTLELFRLGGTLVEQTIDIPEGVAELRRTVTYKE